MSQLAFREQLKDYLLLWSLQFIITIIIVWVLSDAPPLFTCTELTLCSICDSWQELNSVQALWASRLPFFYFFSWCEKKHCVWAGQSDCNDFLKPELRSWVDLELLVTNDGEKPAGEASLLLCIFQSSDEDNGLSRGMLNLTLQNCCTDCGHHNQVHRRTWLWCQRYGPSPHPPEHCPSDPQVSSHVGRCQPSCCCIFLPLLLVSHPKPAGTSFNHGLCCSVVWENCSHCDGANYNAWLQPCLRSLYHLLCLPLPFRPHEDSCRRHILTFLIWETLNFSHTWLMWSWNLVEFLYMYMSLVLHRVEASRVL